MANLKKDFEKFSELFKQNIQEYNTLTIDENLQVTHTDKIAAAYQDVKTSMDNLLVKYLDIGKQQKELADTFIQVLTYMVYHVSLTKSFDEYKSLAAFITMLFDENSELMKLLKLIEEKLIVYTSLDKEEYHIENPIESDSYIEWKQVKTDIELLLKKLFELLKRLLSELGILPENFTYGNEDEQEGSGSNPQSESEKPKIKVKGVRSFSKTFKTYEKYFDAYLGEINRKGYVGQKAKVYMQLPLKRTGDIDSRVMIGGQNLINVSIPLMDISYIDFRNKPKNIIFGWFNIYDYVGESLIENEDDEQKSAYVYTQSFIRFGGLFSGKDIDRRATSQNFRLNYAGSGWTSGKIRKKGTFGIDNVSLTCKFGDKVYYEEEREYPAQTKICDKIDFYEEISSLTDNTRYKLTGELSYDEEYSNKKNEEYAVLEQNLDKMSGKSSYKAPTVDVGELEVEHKENNPEYTGTGDTAHPEYIITYTYEYYWTINGEKVYDTDGQLVKVPPYVAKIVGSKNGRLSGDDAEYYIGHQFNMPKTGTYKVNNETRFSLWYMGHNETDVDFTVRSIKTNVSTSFIKFKKSYFKGTLKLEPLDQSEETDATSGFMSDYTANKDVILEIESCGDYKFSNNTESGTFNITCSLDPESQSNANYNEDNENEASTFLPPIVSNFTFENVPLSGELNITSPELEIAEALLELSNIDMDNFDELSYSGLIDKLNNAKNSLIADLMSKIGEMNALITTIITASSLFQAYDELYTKEYTEDIISEYSSVQNTFQTYLSTNTYDIAELYNGTFTSKVEEGISKINNIFGEILDDVVEAEDTYHNYENKLSYLVNAPKMGISFNSPLSCSYDILSGHSTTVATMRSAGQAVKTYPIAYSYTDWLNLYMTIPYRREESKNYFAETYLLQYLYIITQYYKFYSEGYSNNVRKVNYFLRVLLLRLLKDNIYNSFFNRIYRQDENYNVKKIIEDYVNISSMIVCDNLDFNTYFLNPYIIDCFPELEKFNRYNINDSDQLNIFNMSHICKPLIYKAILNSPSKDINKKLNSVYEFLNNGQRLNIRELLFKYNFYIVIKELLVNIQDSRYRLPIGLKQLLEDTGTLQEMISIIRNYRLLLEDDIGNPISKLMSMETYEISENNKPRTIENVDNLTDEEMEELGLVEINPLEKELTLPKLLINNYTYNAPEKEETPDFVEVNKLFKLSTRRTSVQHLDAIAVNKMNTNFSIREIK